MLAAVLLACPSTAPGGPKPPTDTAAPDSGGSAPTAATASTGATGDTGNAPAPLPDVVSEGWIHLHPDMATLILVDWTQDIGSDEVWLTWTLDGTDHASPVQAVAAATAGHAVVLGVPSLSQVPVTLHAVVDGVERLQELGTATTGSLPQLLENAQLVVDDPALRRPEPWLLTSVDVGSVPFFGPCYTVILDSAGRIVWYRATSDDRLSWQPRVSRLGGYLLVDESTLYSGFSGPPTVSRVLVDLARDEAIELPGMMIAYDELPDGSLVYDETPGSYLFWLTRRYPDGHTERIWDCSAWMDGWDASFWACATNTVQYDPVRNSILWSTFQTSTMVEIDADSGELLREMGAFPGGYDFDPPDAIVELQHSPNWTADGTLIVSTHSPDGQTQWAREFAVDDAGNVLQQVWSLETPHFADYAGQVQKLPSGNVLWQLGVTGVIHELAPDGTVVWQVEWPGHLVGNATPIADLYGLTTGTW